MRGKPARLAGSRRFWPRALSDNSVGLPERDRPALVNQRRWRSDWTKGQTTWGSIIGNTSRHVQRLICDGRARCGMNARRRRPMDAAYYYNPAEELLDRDALHRLQRQKLGAMLAEIRGRNAFYTRKLDCIAFD